MACLEGDRIWEEQYEKYGDKLNPNFGEYSHGSSMWMSIPYADKLELAVTRTQRDLGVPNWEKRGNC